MTSNRSTLDKEVFLPRYSKPSHPKLFDLSEQQRSYVNVHIDKWEKENPRGEIPNYPKLTEWHGELARNPPMASWIVGSLGLAMILSSDGGLEEAAPLLLLGLPVVAFSLYFYFNNVNERWERSRDLYEARLVDKVLSGEVNYEAPWG